LALSDADLANRASELAGQGAGTALIVVFHAQAVDAYPRSALLYYPFQPCTTTAQALTLALTLPFGPMVRRLPFGSMVPSTWPSI